MMWLGLACTPKFVPTVTHPSPIERLTHIATASDPPTALGELYFQGHGSTPGATDIFPFTATVTETSASWVGDPLNERIWMKDGVWTGEPWTRGTPADVLQLTASRPSRLAAWLLEHPFQWRVVGDELLWAVDGGLATLSFRDNRLDRLEWRKNHPVFGDVVNHVTWTDEGVTMAMTEDDTRWSATLTTTSTTATPPPSGPTRVVATELEPGVHVLAIPEADSRVVLITRGDHGVLLDAPLSSSIGTAILEQAHTLAPSVTTWTVVVSHHHPHYTGGLRPWARAGATLVIHEALEDWLRSTLTTPRTGDPAVEPTIRSVSDVASIADGLVQVRAIDDTSGHTEAFLVSMWNDTVYAGDLARATETGARHRGTWPQHLGDWTPTRVVSGFPLSSPAVFDMSLLQEP